MNKYNIKSSFIAHLLLMFSVFITSMVLAENHNQVHLRWAKHDAKQVAEVDHKAMTEILAFITVPNAKQHTYAFYKLSGKALAYLQQYKTYLAQVPVSLLNKNEQLAYWLNLHNVLVIEKIATNQRRAKRLKSRRGEPHKPGSWWNEVAISVEGVALSINDIELEVLAKHWQQPLFVYGLFYGTKGQAFQMTTAFTGKQVESQLASLAQAFYQRRDSLDIDDEEVEVSSLLAWYKKPLFEDDDQKLIAHLKEYASTSQLNKLAKVTEVSDHDFNWSHLIESRPRNISSRSSTSDDQSYVPQDTGYRGGS